MNMGKETIFTGGCLCGAVRYEAQPDLTTAYYCHCRDCQIGSGSAFHASVIAPDSSFRVVSGETSTYTKTADSGTDIDRVFCPKCGTPVWWVSDTDPGKVILTISGLDNPEAITPLIELYTKSALSWSRIPEGTDKFREDTFDPN